MQNLQLRIRKSSADSACHLIYCYHRCCRDRKSTRLNSSHTVISYAVFCLKKKICRVRYRGAAHDHGSQRDGGLAPHQDLEITRLYSSYSNSSHAEFWSYSSWLQ